MAGGLRRCRVEEVRGVFVRCAPPSSHSTGGRERWINMATPGPALRPTDRRPAGRAHPSTRLHDHRQPTTETRGPVRLEAMPGASESRGRPRRRAEPCPDQCRSSVAAPCRLNDENSPAKFQNVRGDSSVGRVRVRLTGRRVPGQFQAAWESLLLVAYGHETKRVRPGARVERDKLRQIDLHWHDLRHEGACRLLGDGVDIRIIQLVLGHSDIKTTQRYLNITDEELRKTLTGVWERRRQLKAVGE